MITAVSLALSACKHMGMDPSFTHLIEQATSGKPEAQLILARYYFEGRGCKRDILATERWLNATQAGVMHDADLEFWVADAFARGDGVESCSDKMRLWLQRAAEHGLPEAQLQLARNCCRGDPSKAVQWFMKAAQQRSGEAARELAICYRDGTGVETDTEAAIRWFRSAIELGDADSGYLLWLELKDKGKNANDFDEAFKWLTKSAQMGCTSAQADLGLLYELGKRVDMDMEKAIEWDKEGALGGDWSAALQLGGILVNGTGGVAKSEKEGSMWLEIAAETVPDLSGAVRDRIRARIPEKFLARAKQDAAQMIARIKTHKAKQVKDRIRSSGSVPSSAF